MTGGQPVELQITAVDMVNQLLSEGVRPVRLATDHPEPRRAPLGDAALQIVATHEGIARHVGSWLK